MTSIEKLFSRSWISSGYKVIFLILYTPLGLALLLLRLFISLQLIMASYVLPTGSFPRRVALRVLYAIMGIFVQEKDYNKKTNKCKLIISNHITPFDTIAISLIDSSTGVSVYNLPPFLTSLFGYKDFGVSQGKEVVKNNIKSYLNEKESLPVVLHPEGATTNGRVALMKYNSWPFEINDTVFLIGLEVKRFPLLPIESSVLGSTFSSDIFFILFSPVTIYTVRYIGCLSKLEGETSEEFANKAQKITAKALKLEGSNHLLADKIEYIKRLAREEATANNPFFSPEVHSMALQVKEILPYLPIDTIKRDLVRTRNVDTTIANFLEGNVPEATSLRSNTTILLNSLSNSSETTNTSPTNQCFLQKKRQLIESGRKKYIEKHGLYIPGYNC